MIEPLPAFESLDRRWPWTAKRALSRTAELPAGHPLHGAVAQAPSAAGGTRPVANRAFIAEVRDRFEVTEEQAAEIADWAVEIGTFGATTWVR